LAPSVKILIWRSIGMLLVTFVMVLVTCGRVKRVAASAPQPANHAGRS
jgi:hypothetical protein